jgi:hypothetical protein
MTAVMPSMMLPFTLKVPMVRTRITAAAMLAGTACSRFSRR